MRDYELFVPADRMISNTVKENCQARVLLKKYLKADLQPSNKIKLPHHAKTKQRR